jgi:hypothetical protein
VDQKNLRMLVLVGVVALLGVFVYRGMGARNNIPAKDAIARLECTVPSAFNSAMGHTQALHDTTGAVAVAFASIAPNGALAGWTTPQNFEPGDHGQMVAFICATASYPKLGLAGGSTGNELWLRHSGKGDAPADWRAYMHQVGTERYARLTVFRRDTSDDATKHPPGHAQWLDGDENIWVSCGRGCCYVTGGGGADTTK